MNNGKIDNKYQESLNHLYNRASDREYWCKRGADEDARDILQELIDNYTKYNEDKSCHYICDTKALLEEELSIVKERLSITERALDKACELLEKFQTEDAISNDIFGKIEIISKEKWKNYLLKESEKQ